MVNLNIIAAAPLVVAAVAQPLFAETQLSALFMTHAAYDESAVRAMTEGFTAASPGITVKLDFVPYEDLHDRTLLSHASDTGYDVVLFDVIWPAEYAEMNVLLDVSDRITQPMRDGILPGAWTTVDYNGRAYGLPWMLDTKYLYYNKQILSRAGIDAPPATWEELARQARIIADMGLLEHPIVWSWAQAEALICDYATLVSAFGGSFVKDGGLTFRSDGGLAALSYMVDSYTSGLTNPDSTGFLEEDARRLFQNGEAAFTLNWTYMYQLANDHNESRVAGRVGIAPAPGSDGRSTVSAVNGSMGLGIPSNSRHPQEAWDYILFLTSQQQQNAHARLSLPIWASSYADPAVTAGQGELIAAARVALAAMFPRPATPRYQEMSAALQAAIRDALLGQASPEAAMTSAAGNGN